MALEPDVLLERARSVQPGAKQHLVRAAKVDLEERTWARPIQPPPDDPFADADASQRPWLSWHPPEQPLVESPWLKELYNQVHAAIQRGNQWMADNPDPPADVAEKAVRRYLLLGHQAELLKLATAATLCPWPGCPANPAAPTGTDPLAGRFRAWQMSTDQAELPITTPAGRTWHLVPYRTDQDRLELTPAELAAVVRVAHLVGKSELEILDLRGEQ